MKDKKVAMGCFSIRADNLIVPSGTEEMCYARCSNKKLIDRQVAMLKNIAKQTDL